MDYAKILRVSAILGTYLEVKLWARKLIWHCIY